MTRPDDEPWRDGARTPPFFDEVRKKFAAMLRCMEQGTLGAAPHTYAHADALRGVRPHLAEPPVLGLPMERDAEERWAKVPLGNFPVRFEPG